jgi:hypothetical protein
MRRCPGRAQSGQTLIMFAITMTFMFLSLIALVGDADVLMVRYNQVDSEALLGAQAGATAINRDALYAGTYELDTGNGPGGVQDRCQTAAGGNTATHHVLCDPEPQLNPNTVTVTVSEDVDLPVPLFMARATVRATRTGRPVFGGQQVVVP